MFANSAFAVLNRDSRLYQWGTKISMSNTILSECNRLRDRGLVARANGMPLPHLLLCAEKEQGKMTLGCRNRGGVGRELQVVLVG